MTTTTFDEPARVKIVDPTTGRTIGECHGATGFGACPMAADGGPVPCAGCRLLLGEGTGMEGWILTVARDASDACPLAFLPLRDGR